MVMSLIVIDSDGSRILRVANNLWCFTGRFTELSDSELPSSTVMGVAYRSLRNFNFGCVGNLASICEGGVAGGVGGAFIELIILDDWGSFVGVFRVGGGSHDRC